MYMKHVFNAHNDTGGSFLLKQVPTESTHMKIRQLVCMFCVWAQLGQVTHYSVIPLEEKKKSTCVQLYYKYFYLLGYFIC